MLSCKMWHTTFQGAKNMWCVYFIVEAENKSKVAMQSLNHYFTCFSFGRLAIRLPIQYDTKVNMGLSLDKNSYISVLHNCFTNI